MSRTGFLFHRQFKELLARRGLGQPDGRPLHRYRLTQDEYDRLREDLARICQRGEADPEAMEFCAALCLFVSEWFKRAFDGGQWSWDRPCQMIGFRLDAKWRPKVIGCGLGWWGLDVLRGLGNDRMWLFTLVIQGGIPTRLVTREAGWLSNFAGRVLRDVENSDATTPEAAFHWAARHALLVPESFRREPLLLLVAELVAALVGLRQRIGKTADAVAMLDASEPLWRESLPIALDDAAVRSFINGLVRSAAADRETPILVDRCIGRDRGGTLCFGVALRLDGRLTANEVPKFRSPVIEGVLRLRLMPSGLLAEQVRGCLAILDQPDEHRTWQSRSLHRGERTVLPFALDRNVTAFLLSGEDPLDEIILPGGQKADEDILVFRSADPGRSDADDLRLLGIGSVRSREPVLFVAIRDAENQNILGEGGAADPIDTIEPYTLFRVRGVVRVGTTDGLSYRIATGVNDESASRLEATGEIVPDLSASVPVFRGLPAFRRLLAGGLVSSVPDRLLRWRRRGGAWQPLDRTRPPIGPIEVATFEADAVIRDRIRLAVTPDGASIRRGPRGRTPSVEISGFAAIDILPRATANRIDLTPNGDDCIVLSTGGAQRPPRTVPVVFRWPEGGTLEADVPLIGAEVAFYDASGLRIDDRAQYSLDGLRGATVEANGPAMLWVELVHDGRRDDALTVERRFAGSLPLAHIRNDILDLMACSDQIDCQVRLNASGAGPDARIDVQRFDPILSREGETIVFKADALHSVPASARIEIVGRPFARLLDDERTLDALIASEAGGRRIAVPDGEGPWLVYARIAGLVRSRPILMSRSLHETSNASDAPGGDGCRLTAAMLVGPPKERVAAIDGCLEAAAAGIDYDTLAALRRIIHEFTGQLPLQSFEALKRLCRHRGAGVALLATADEDPDLVAILGLSRELPFWWQLTPLRVWIECFRRWRETISAMFAATDLREPDRTQLVGQVMAVRLERIGAIEPTLAGHLACTRLALAMEDGNEIGKLLRLPTAALASIVPNLIREAADDCIRRNAERSVWPRSALRALHRDLPEELHRFDENALTVLDAPHLAAAVACDLLSISPEIEQVLRACRGFDPIYFNEAFQLALLRFFGAGLLDPSFRQGNDR